MLRKLEIKKISFSWDNYSDNTMIVRKFKAFKKKTNLMKNKLAVNVLTNYNTTIEQDLERITKLHELGYSPYVMVYERNALPANHIARRMQRWVNCQRVFNACPDWKEYLKGKKRIKKMRKAQAIELIKML
jgi:adenylosuccinate synthase